MPYNEFGEGVTSKEKNRALAFRNKHERLISFSNVLTIALLFCFFIIGCAVALKQLAMMFVSNDVFLIFMASIFSVVVLASLFIVIKDNVKANNEAVDNRSNANYLYDAAIGFLFIVSILLFIFGTLFSLAGVLTLAMANETGLQNIGVALIAFLLCAAGLITYCEVGSNMRADN